jgi:hypothetical protein
MYVPGHRDVCKHLFVIEVLGDDEAEPPATGDPTISLHALTGIQPSLGRTMQIPVSINGVILTTLLDSGSTHNFVDVDIAARAGLQFHAVAGLRVAMANNDRISSPRGCKALWITVGGEPFDVDIHGLALSSFDVVLDVQWLESLGPILWDFTNRTIAFVRNGRRVKWTVAGTTSPTPSITAASADLLPDFLQEFMSLFQDPTGLPPQRQWPHCICLLPGTAPVAVRPYRYAHLQKVELEKQCARMLVQGVIRPSSSAFSAPVILIKKADDSWRLCVDYRALNEKTIKDKFPIPVVEELLNELHGAQFFTKLDLCSGYHQVRMHPDDVEKTVF